MTGTAVYSCPAPDLPDPHLYTCNCIAPAVSRIHQPLLQWIIRLIALFIRLWPVHMPSLVCVTISVSIADTMPESPPYLAVLPEPG